MDREREWGREGGNDESGLKINYCNLGKDPLVYSRGREITSSRDSRISLSLSVGWGLSAQSSDRFAQ